MWELCALTGVGAGIGWAWVLGAFLQESLQLVPVGATAALCLYIGWMVFRRWRGWPHRHVLLEGLALFLLPMAAASLWLGAGLRGLDIGMVGFSLAMVGGRLGCFCAGCCFGQPSSLGLRWPAHCPAGSPPFRRLPVQLFEALLWLGLAAIGSLSLWVLLPGQSTGLLCVVYAPTRFAIEFWRDDAIRGSWWGLSTSQWASFVLLLFALPLLRPSVDSTTVVATTLCVSAWTVMWRLRSSYLPRLPPLPISELHEVAQGWRGSGPHLWSKGEIEAGLLREEHIEAWVAGPQMTFQEAELLLESICCGLGMALPENGIRRCPGPGLRRIYLLKFMFNPAPA